jgi:hypothetical protein
MDDKDEVVTGATVSSSTLAASLDDGGEAVISLDGTSLSQEQLAEVRQAFANEVPEDINRL